MWEERTIPIFNAGQTESINVNRSFAAAIVRIENGKGELLPIRASGHQDSFSMGCIVHNHSHYELVYVLEGVFTQHLESSTIRLNAGDAAFLNCNIRHCEDFDSNCICVYMNFSAHLFRSLLTGNEIDLGVPQHACSAFEIFCTDSEDALRAALIFRSMLSRRAQFEDLIILRTSELINRISDELIQRKPGYAYIVQGLLVQLLSYMEQSNCYHITHVLTDDKNDDVLFSDIMHYMNERLGRISREELARLLHYHPDHLGRVAKRYTGKTLVQLGQSIWLDWTKEQLRTTDRSITELLHTLGFEGKQYFYRIFAEDTGMTPQIYRENSRARSANQTNHARK